MMTTESEKPPMKPSGEAKEKQLQMAKEQGEPYVNALKYMVNQEADTGGEKPAGEYIVAYALEKAEGLYSLENGELIWHEPTDENLHVEVAVRDAADNRFIPGLEVYVTLIDSNGRDIGKHRQEFLWHPWLYHYGRNWEVPSEGVYTLRVRVEPPKFLRHDKKNGKRYTEPVEVEFQNVNVKTGRKIT